MQPPSPTPIAPPTRSWRDQWDRIHRWYGRFRSTVEGRTHDMDSLNYDDEVYAFFESTWHLQDWLKNDPAHPLARVQDVEDFANSSDPLRWCADITNGSKHLEANREPRVDPNTGIGGRHYSVTLGTEPTPTTISVSYDIVGAGQCRDAMALADECLAAWEQFLKKHGLL